MCATRRVIILSVLALLTPPVLMTDSEAQSVIATVPTGNRPQDEALNSVTNKTYVVNYCGNDSTCASSGTVTVIDGASLSTQTVPVGFLPDGVAVNSVTNQIYVANSCGSGSICNNGTVTVIDGATLGTKTVSVGQRPGAVAVNEVKNQVYVGNFSDGTVTVIDGQTLSTQTVTVGSNPISIAVNPVTNTIYVANGLQNVTVIDGKTLATTTVTVGNVPYDLAINSVTNQIYVANSCATCQLGTNGTVTIIDGATLSTQTVTVEIHPFALSVDSATNKIYVANFCGTDPYCDSNGTVTVIDGTTLAMQTVTVGSGPVDIRVDSVTHQAYVANAYGSCRNCLDGSTTVVDGATLATVNVGGAGSFADKVLVNPVTNRIYAVSLCRDRVSCDTGIVSVIDGTPPTALRFVPATPCRVTDTRQTGKTLQAGVEQSFVISGTCGIPTTAAAYSLNLTVVPPARLGFLTVWPTGLARPNVSTLNSLDGRTKADAAVLPAGTNGAVSAYATNNTDLVIDIDGYFVPATDTTALAFYALTPCRVIDTRNSNGDLAGPYLKGNVERDFPVLESACIPQAVGAQAYSFNVTVVPHPTGQRLGFLTVWPEGEAQPAVSTLNNPTGTIVANAAIVPAGTGGGISVFPNNDTDLLVDINGYFAPPVSGGLSFYTVAPCRALDTRATTGAFTGLLTPPLNVVASPCGAWSTAQGFVLNATVVPTQRLGFLTLWPDGETRPAVSTLNAVDGYVTNNMAIVPSMKGSIDAFASGTTNLILDLFGYFAP